MKKESLIQIREYLVSAHNEAEGLHDQDGEYCDYEVMEETKRLIDEIDEELAD